AWSGEKISAAPLPQQWIWDVVVDPDDENVIYVVCSGFATQHVFKGVVGASGAMWTAASGAGAGALPDAPVFAMTIRPGNPKTFYIGTDVGVYVSTNPAASWTLFNSGLPNTAV